jgi:hypothetical protein
MMGAWFLAIVNQEMGFLLVCFDIPVVADEV